MPRERPTERHTGWFPPAKLPKTSPGRLEDECSKHSVSASIKKLYKQHRKYNAYKCVCQALIDGAQAEGYDEETHPGKAMCDGGQACACGKPTAEHPEHPSTITVAGYQKFLLALANTDLRNPEYFDMYVYNDTAGYGVLEVLQNFVVDFIQAQDNWKEQWAVCEAIPLYWSTGAAMPFTMLDADTVTATCSLLGRMFLAMLATMESRNLLEPGSDVQDLGVVVRLYLSLANELRRDCDEPCLDESFDVSRFDAYVVAYAKKHQLHLKDPSNIGKLMENFEDEGDDETRESIELPPCSADPWKWRAAHEAYAANYGKISSIGKKGMGGDSFDISTWSSTKRMKHNFDGIDPLGEKEIDTIVQDIVAQLESTNVHSGPA